jgi:signal transduction histidine kinase
MNKGYIPVTDNTIYLMDDLEKWIDSLSKAPEKNVICISRQIDLIKKTLKFISNQGRVVEQFSREGEFRTNSKLGPFNYVSGSINNTHYLILIREEQTHSNIVGFKLNLEYLRNELQESKDNYLQASDISYQIISKEQSLQQKAEYLLTTRELSPLVPFWRVILQPKNPGSISRYVIEQRWIYGIAIALLLSGMILGIVLVIRDMSRERKLAQLRTDLVSSVTHELKTPLTSIRMFAETMKMGRIRGKTEQQEYLNVIVNETERLTRLVNTVLDFSKIEQGEKQYHFNKINLSNIVERAVGAMKYWLKENEFKIKMDIDEKIELEGDGDALEQAVLNLLSNAIKYSNEKKEIYIRLFNLDDSIHLEIKDYGLGIPESKQSRIFDKYYRAHYERYSDKGGSGLGLAVVKHIVESHKGRIELKSKVNEGSKFTIILPKKIVME